MQFLRETSATTRTGSRRRRDADRRRAGAGAARRAPADLNAAEVQLAVSQAIYAQVIGSPPGKLEPAEPDRPAVAARARGGVAMPARSIPAVLGADVRCRRRGVRDLSPKAAFVPLQRAGQRRAQRPERHHARHQPDRSGLRPWHPNVPIYDGGIAASQTRQAKERPRRPHVLEPVRSQAQTAVIGAWVANEGAKVALAASERSLGRDVALDGVQKEAQGGKRTTLDVLNCARISMEARPRLIAAQHDRWSLPTPCSLRRPPRRQDARPRHAGLSARGALPPGPRRLGRLAHAIRTVAVRRDHRRRASH